MEGAIIKKILNNNVVIAKEGNKEFILVGNGIGFDFHKGNIVPSKRIEKVFVRENTEIDNNYDKVLETIDNKIIGISEEIICMAEMDIGVKLSKPIHVSLPDHINFSLRRMEKKIKIENPFLNELKVLYPKEYSIASKALEMINVRFNVELPQDEIGFICLHIKAAIEESGIGTQLEYTKKIKDIMDLISNLIGRTLHKDSLEYARTLTHINFMLERILTGKTVNNLLLDTIKDKFSKEYAIAIKLSLKIEALFSVRVPEDETGYLAVHLKRLSDI
ncbi:PRD domain-containing protein [Clostridium pasteurianum]|uniref:PRD domain-containing protein n=1 Tax=Clostridium pasteurianum TaxID=1501 RepID=UPI002260CCB6|nr:PRD domain-containing protein [Clostridium pasteurianum]UZW15984.1 PRD domain-containing protein [Clostridium pasteurianum]